MYIININDDTRPFLKKMFGEIFDDKTNNWVVVDEKTRKIVLISSEYPENSLLDTDPVFMRAKTVKKYLTKIA